MKIEKENDCINRFVVAFSHSFFCRVSLLHAPFGYGGPHENRPIDDETYQTLGALEYVDHPEQKNFRNLLFTFKFKYSDGVENIQTELTEPFSQLLTTDVYWSGEGFEYDDTKRKEYTA